MRKIVVNDSSPAYAKGLVAIIEDVLGDCEVEVNKTSGMQDTSIQFDDKTLVLLDDASMMQRTFCSKKFTCKAIVLKTSDIKYLREALVEMDAGSYYIDPACDQEEQAHDETLTDRQQEILQLFADGVKTEKVAEALGLSGETIRTHTKRILAKINASTRTEAVAIAIRNGYID